MIEGVRKVIFLELRKNQIIEFQEFYKLFYKYKKTGLGSFYNFLVECKSLGLIEEIREKEYLILVD